nr:hypothetical protein [Tanacetum cinerariifolium]
MGEGSALPTDPQHTPTILQSSSSQPQKTQKRRKPKRKNTQVPQPSSSTGMLQMRNYFRWLSWVPRSHGDTIAQTRFENVSKISNDSLLIRCNTLQSDEDRMKLNELMKLCTNLQLRVLALEKTKTTQALEIASLKRRDKKLKKKQRSRTHKLKRLYKVGLTAMVDSSEDEENLDDAEMFDVNDLQGEEVFVDKEVADKDLIVDVEHVNAASEFNIASIATTNSAAATIIIYEVTLAKALVELEASKPKVKRVVIQDPSIAYYCQLKVNAARHNLLLLGDSLVRAATATSSLEAEQDSGNINKTQSKATPNESSSQGTSLGGGPRCQEAIRDTSAQTRFERVSTHSNDSLLARESSGDEASLGEDASKQGRRINDIDADADITLVNDVDNEIFYVDMLGGEEMFVAGQAKNVVEEVVDTAQHKKKDQIRLDEEAILKLQAELNEEERLTREKELEKEQKANIALIETWDDIPAKIDVDHQLAKILQAQKQEELYDAEKATLFQQLLEKRRNHFAAKRAEDKRNKPPTQAQKRKMICTYQKNMKECKLKDLKVGGKKRKESMRRADTREYKEAKESSGDEASLGDDASKQGRRIDDIDDDADITLVNDVDNEIFDVDMLGGEEMFVAGQAKNVVEEVVDTAQVSTAATTATTEELTLAQALKALKTLKPKVNGIVFKSQHKKKYQIRLDEEAVLKLQAELNEEERLIREKELEKEQKANIALIETWDDIPAKIDVDHQLAKILQAQEQEELYDAEKATLFQQLLEKRRKHFAAKRAEDKRNKPPTQAQKRKMICTYLKNMKECKLKDLKLKEFNKI